MDLQFLQRRCARGKEEVAAFMDSSHRYVKLNTLADAHADLVQFQRDQGAPNGLLDQICIQVHPSFHLMQR